MARVNLWVPDALLEQVRQLEDVNYSALYQEMLRGLLSCEHEQLVCGACAVPIDKAAVIDQHLSAFYVEALARIGEVVYRNGTAEGAARVLKDVAERRGVTAVDRDPLPRPSRNVPRPKETRERRALSVVDPIDTEGRES